MKTKDQAIEFLKNLEERSNPVAPSTLTLYNSALNNHILPLFGDMDLGLINSNQMNVLVKALKNKGLKPASINTIMTIFKSLVISETDDNGDSRFKPKWNRRTVDAPEVKKRDQKTPTVTAEVITTAISKATGHNKALYALLAGTGLRVSESFGLKVEEDDKKSSFWMPSTATLIIRQQMYRGKEKDPKTDSGIREVDLCTQLNAYLIKHTSITSGLLFQNGVGGPLVLTGRLYDIAHDDGVPGFHSFRRWRITHLRINQTPENLSKFWVGHGSGKADITNLYDRSSDNVIWRKKWAEKVGLGFELPEDTK